MKKFLLFFFLLCFTIGNSQTKDIDSLIKKGITFEDQGQYPAALESYQNALNRSLILKDKTSIGKCYLNMGNVYLRKGDYPKALNFYTKSLHVSEEINDKERIADCYSSIGTIYGLQSDNSNGLIYITKALKIAEELKNKPLITSSYNHLGSIYFNTNEYQKALACYQNALKISEELCSINNISGDLGSIGAVYKKMGQYEMALEYSTKQLKLAEKSGDKAGLADALYNIGGIFVELKRNNEALDCFNKTMILGRELGSAETVRYAYDGIVTVHYNTGNFKEAFDNYEKFKLISDSIYNIEKSGQINEIKIKYETEKKEAENKALSQQNEIQSLKLNQNKFFIIGLSVLILLVLLVAFLLFKQNKFRNQQRELLLEQKLLRLQMNPHFIFNSLIAIESFIHTKQPDEAREYLSDFAKLMRLILENSREETVSLQKEIDTLNYYLRLQKLTLEDTFTYTVTLSKDLDTEEVQLPPMLIQPFIENAIKHGVNNIAKGHIEIVITKENENLIIEIKDNGKGIFENESKSSHTSLATTITKERLLNINLRKKQKINFKINSIASKGTQVIFTIPLV